MANCIILTFTALLYFGFCCLISGQTFGYNNRYTCHCNNNRCDVNTGRCIDGASCQPAWYGSTCQKENVALNKSTYSNTQYRDHLSSYAVDGDTTHHNENLKCYHAGVYTPGIPNYWQVDLQQRYPIRDIKIYLRDGWKYRLKGFYINTDNSSNTGTACRSPAGTIPDSVFTIPVKCEGRYLRFSNTNVSNPFAHVNLCEVEVYVCSPGTYGSDCTSYCYCKSPTDRCTDGMCPNGCVSGYTGDSCNTTCYGASCMYKCSDRKCSIPPSPCDVTTGECNGGCQIGYKLLDCRESCDIGVNYGINCSKLCSDRDCFNKESSCDQFNGTCNNTECNQGYTGDDCTQGCQHSVEYGRNCKYRCNTRNCLNPSSSCDVKTGECVGGCKIGYKPPDCQQKCDSNINYGDQCLKKCSDRKCLNTSTSCDYRTGACYKQQCKAGYQGVDCSQVCDVDVNYGDRCSNMCSERNCLIDRSSCDYITGKCEGGCKPGYRDDDCKQICSIGFYGDGCNQTCESRECKINSNTCNHEDGSCGVDGCLPGYQFKDCSQQCTGRTYGLGCTLNCDDRNCVNNTICDISIGKCEGSCNDGFELDDCTQKIVQEEMTGAILGSVLAVVFSGSIAIIVIIVFRRRKAAHQKSNVADNYTLPTRNSDDHIYNDAEIVYENIDSSVGDDENPTKSNSQAKSKEISKKTSSVKPTLPVPDTQSEYYYNLPSTRPDDVPNTEWNAMDKVNTKSNVPAASSHEQDRILTDFAAKYGVELNDVRQKMKLKAVLFEELGVKSSKDLDFVEVTDLSDVLTPIELRRFTTIKNATSTPASNRE